MKRTLHYIYGTKRSLTASRHHVRLSCGRGRKSASSTASRLEKPPNGLGTFPVNCTKLQSAQRIPSHRKVYINTEKQRLTFCVVRVHLKRETPYRVQVTSTRTKDVSSSSSSSRPNPISPSRGSSSLQGPKSLLYRLPHSLSTFSSAPMWANP